VRLFFDQFDLLLSPTMPIPAAYADPRDDDAPNSTNFPSWMPYTSPFNLTKNPSCSISCGLVDGLPLDEITSSADAAVDSKRWPKRR